jgi:hypothetical protein
LSNARITEFYVSNGLTTSTGHGARRTMRSARLPMIRLYKTEWPLAPTTKKLRFEIACKLYDISYRMRRNQMCFEILL